MSQYKSVEERLHEKYIKDPDTGCWLWTGGVGEKGYGRFWYKGKTIQAHRCSWMLHNGPIPKGLLVCHHCDTPGCVNPAHLFIGTLKDNMGDCIQKGRFYVSRHENHYKAKLTWAKVGKIRLLRKEGITPTKIAKIYNVTQSLISAICNNRKWKVEERGYSGIFS